MKKVLISMMLVVLTLCLFVGCSSSPKAKEEMKSISFTDGTETFTFNSDGSGSYTLSDSTYPFTSIEFSTDVDKGLKVTYSTGSSDNSNNLYKGQQKSDGNLISNFEELYGLPAIWIYNGWSMVGPYSKVE